jgi:hypothetical protein
VTSNSRRNNPANHQCFDFEDSAMANVNSDLKLNQFVHFAAQNEREAEDEFGFHCNCNH